MSFPHAFVAPRYEPLFKDLTYDAGAVVQNTWYTALEGDNIELDGFAIGITVADETIEYRITVDGQTYTVGAGINLLFAGNAWTANQGLRISNNPKSLQSVAPAASVDLQNSTNRNGWLWKGKHLKLEVKKTTAAGASHILVRAIYHQW